MSHEVSLIGENAFHAMTDFGLPHSSGLSVPCDFQRTVELASKNWFYCQMWNWPLFDWNSVFRRKGNVYVGWKFPRVGVANASLTLPTPPPKWCKQVEATQSPNKVEGEKPSWYTPRYREEQFLKTWMHHVICCFANWKHVDMCGEHL